MKRGKEMTSENNVTEFNVDYYQTVCDEMAAKHGGVMTSTFSQISNLSELFINAVEKYPENPAFSCLDQTLSFKDVNEKAEAFAGYLSQLGLNQGDRIAIQLPNLIQYPVAVYAAFKVGLVVVNTNPLYTPKEMQHQFKDSGAKAIVILDALLPKLEAIQDNTDIQHVVITSPADFITQEIAEAKPGSIRLNQAIEKGRGQSFEPTKAGKEDLAVLQYTGGTTGVSKGASLTHGNLIANAWQLGLRLEEHCKQGQEIFVCPLPLYHIYAFTVNMLLFTGQGNLNILIPNPRDMDAFVNALKPFKFTGISGLNTLFVGLCRHPEFQKLDFSRLSLTISGGTALTTAASNIWKEVTGCSISEGYGLSETSPVIALNAPGREQIGCVGEALEGTEVQFWDLDDKPVPEGESGQLVVRGPQVMRGYWNQPEANKEAISETGFFKTGDVGLRQPDGYIKIVDRMKDIIIVSGFNVYPNEVEDTLVSHPDVFESAVIGEADERTGERVHAFIVLSNPCDEQTIIDYCKTQLTNYKVPKQITFLDELPKSTVGKILRRELRSH